MAPLNGKTLGEKHRSYNLLLKETIAQGNANLQKINYDADDIDNMINIDISCIEKNVDYVMDVLRCGDLLYVTRAIKKSSWLITETKYAHLINPDYLDLNVFPEMTTQGIAKLLFHIRLHLRDEKRVEDFFNYVLKKRNPKMAVKWLEHCSFSFLKDTVTKYATFVSSELLKRLCKKHSLSILEMYVSGNFSCYPVVTFQSVMFLLKSDTEKFLNLTDDPSNWMFNPPKFSKKATQFLMKHCYKRILDKFQCYQGRIHIPTFITYLKRHDIGIESFILSESVKTFYDLKPFLDHVSQDRALDLLRRKNEIRRIDDDENADKGRTEVEELFYAIESYNSVFSYVYRWYEFAPHDIAFRDLQKFIYADSSPEERHSMLIVLLTNARKNMDQVRIVLQYYHDKHINEPYINKIEFVKSVLAQHDTFRFDEATWLILNKIFHSLDVYIQSKNKVQECLVAIIIRSVLNDEPVHEIVEQRFYFKTLVQMKNKLNENEQEKLFNYLHNYLATQLRSQDVNTELEMKKAVALITNTWRLLKDWKREKTHYHFLLESIIEIGHLNLQLSLNTDLKFLTSVVKRYCNKITENALFLYPCEEMCIHVLKYDFDLLVRNKAEVKALCLNSKVSLKTLFSKLRIYWRESLATEWRIEFVNDLQNGKGNEDLVRGVFLLSSQRQILDFIKKNSPSKTDETDTSMREYIAKSMHLARPQLPVEVVLSYAKGDCLQHTLCSVNFIYNYTSVKEFYRHIDTLLTSSSVSLQKQGIRVAFDRMKIEELLDVLYTIWKTSRNRWIRNMLFQFVSELLRKEDGTLQTETWNLLSFMIDDLNYKDNINIYRTLYYLSRVPNSVIGDYYQKSYASLKKLAEKIPDNSYMFNSILNDADDFIQYLDCSFVENTILVPVYDIFKSNSNYTQLSILVAYLLCSKDEVTQMRKYQNLFVPLFTTWENNKFDSAILDSIQSFLKCVARALPKFVYEMNMVMPLKILTSIKNKLEYKYEKYDVTIQWKLFVGYIKVLDEIVVKNPEERNWENVRNESVYAYSKVCVEYLRDDIENCCPSIYLLFSSAITQVLDMFQFDKNNVLKLLNSMLDCKDLHVYMCVLKTLPDLYSFQTEAQVILNVIRKKLYNFPSKELKMHYFARYSSKYDIEDCI